MNFNKRLRVANEKFEAGEHALEIANYQQAVDDFLEASELFKGIKGEEQNYAGCLGNAANTLKDLGNYTKAEILLNKAISIQKKILGAEHPDVAKSLNNLATIYQTQGDYAKATEFYEKALAIKEKLFGSQHPDVAKSLNNLANIYYLQGDYAKAIEFNEKALAIREKHFGSQHPNAAMSLHNLANIYYLQGDYAKATEFNEKALAIQEKHFGSQHPDVANSLNNLANIYQDQGDYAKATEFNEKALAIKEKLFGSQHPDVASSLGNLANIYKAQSNYAKATEFNEKALAIQEKHFGSQHPDVASSLNNLATIYQAQGDYAKATEFHEKALAIREKHFGSQHPDVAGSLNNLALIYEKLGEKEKAQAYYQRAQAIINTVFDENHPTAQLIKRNYLELQAENERLKQQEREQRIIAEENKKLSYLSYMASGIAHNINNPVGILRLAAQRGLKALEKGELTNETGQEIFQRILKQADRLHDIIEKFREFAQGDRKRVENIDLNAIVSQVKEYFASQLDAHKISLQIELSPDNPQALANNFILQEILINLITNARDALEKIDHAQILIKTWKNAETVSFSVCDNGTGISEEQQKNLFSPFHSTKAHGTGLGLHFVKKSLEELKGNIDYQDNIPQGACFNIELPIGNN